MYRRRVTRREVLQSGIVDALRDYSLDAQHVGHAFANLHGLGATDLQALIAVMDAEGKGEPITPGRLGEQLNLSSGSVTALIDRLERAGHIRRDRDTADRRKVFLRYAEPGARLAVEFFSPLGRRSDRVMSGFTEAELEVVHQFLTAMTGTLREHRDEMRGAGTSGPDSAGTPR
ncbi:MarR family winged helix-turn-helix transcriptional regulator [Plantactinospora sp. GCM10030261]|uniref:MarR family winged helix-turn-helix transcriptional regulator n=1 Tax=Plantactinospora sp. GCM10030261 TaxID=3273420 RepID=UPI003605ADEE